MNCAAIPLLLGARILFADWVSAVVVVLTVPLVPVFMVLIGRYTEDRVRAAQSALARLSGHMLELAKGLPVLVGLGRATAQRKALEDISEQYRSRTMDTLRTAFLSALALELIATISVAVVAVFIGVRLVHGDMALEAGLLALILAPDCYLPLRELGTAHHASDDGRAALAEVTAVMDAPEAVRAAAPERQPAGQPQARKGVRRRRGPSGGDRQEADGYVRRTAGTRRRAAQLRRARRADHRPRRRQRCRQEHHSRRPGGNRRHGRRYSGERPHCRVLAVGRRLGAAASGHGGDQRAGRGAGSTWGAVLPGTPAYRCRRLPAHCQKAAQRCLEAAGAGHLAAKHPAELSPGELRRVALARGLARIEAGATLLLLDEPTAHLDRESANVVNNPSGSFAAGPLSCWWPTTG